MRAGSMAKAEHGSARGPPRLAARKKQVPCHKRRMPRKPYDHARYAANQGDVWKHWALARVLDGLARNGAPFHYAETHAGPGETTLAGRGEWRRGLGRLVERVAFQIFMATP